MTTPERVINPDVMLKDCPWIEGYDGLYKITRNGRVFSIHTGEWRERKLYEKETGYLALCLRDKYGKRSNAYAHQLVAKHYVAGFSKGMTVNHKNLDKLDNRAENLEWVTNAENIKHGWESGVYRKRVLKQCMPVEGTNIKTGEKIRFESAKEAQRNGFNESHLRTSIRKNGVHKGYVWRFL